MHKFRKIERLCSKKKIETLFAEGKSFIKYPLRISFLVEEGEEKIPCKLLIVVPKKRIKKAVKRNLVKRRIREAYRTSKNDLSSILTEKEVHINIMFLFLSNEPLEFKEIKKSIEKSFESIKEGINKAL